MKVLVVHCHPLEESLVAAVRDRALTGLRRAGHAVDVVDLYADGFDPLDGAIERYVRALRWADALVLVHPTWWGGQPAMLKGWLDRVWTGATVDAPSRRGLRNIRRIVLVTTHGSPKRINVLQGEPGKRLRRYLRAGTHPLCRTRWLALYGVDVATDAARGEFLDLVERRFSRF